MIAITRAVSPAINGCERTHIPVQPIYPERAARQHSAYEQALERLGATLIRAAALPAMADAVFVEDMAVVFDEIAIIGSSTVVSRRGEAESIAALLNAHRICKRIEPPGFLEGGDILRVGRKVYAGLSTRTNQNGIDCLRAFLSPFDYEVKAAPVRECLHLKTACSYLGRNQLLANPGRIDIGCFRDLEIIEVPAGEQEAANVLAIGDRILMPMGFPRTCAVLQSRGWLVETLDISELQKAEAGLTCMSILFGLVATRV
jgi:dimethylargininase